VHSKKDAAAEATFKKDLTSLVRAALNGTTG
jgi:hypothetical protein